MKSTLARGAFVVLIIGGLALSACNDFLTDVRPADSLPLENSLDNPKSLQSFLEGTYAFLATGPGDFILLLTDLMTSDTDLPISDHIDFAQNNIPPSNSDIRNIWATHYRVINQANIVIGRVEDMRIKNEISADEADRMTGEALFLRGAMHFELVRVFALPLHKSSLGIPLMTAGIASTDELAFPERNTTGEVYAQVQSDLEQAALLLPTENGFGKATKFAAEAYLARVLFHIEDYDAASQILIQIIDSAGFALTQDPEEYFRLKGTVEDVWSVAHSSNERGRLYSWTNVRSGDVNRFGLALDAYERIYSQAITPTQKNALQANDWTAHDQRFTELTALKNADTSQVFSDKYADINSGDNNPVLRYAEVLLMYAECLARQGSTQEAIDYLNMIRRRAFIVTDSDGNDAPEGLESIVYQSDDFASSDELIEAIILERQIEFMMEGHRFHDLIRLRRNVNGLLYDDDMLRFPIPISEIDSNPNLEQNPGY